MWNILVKMSPLDRQQNYVHYDEDKSNYCLGEKKEAFPAYDIEEIITLLRHRYGNYIVVTLLPA